MRLWQLAKKIRPWMFVLVAVTAVLSISVWWLVESGAFRGRPRSQNLLAAESKNVLENAEVLELLSLDPVPLKEHPEEGFHGYAILGAVKLNDSVKRKALLRALYAGITNSDGSVAACFNPRHGLRAKLGSEVVELVICFECHQIETHATNGRSVLTDASAQPVFDKALTDAGVPLPKDPH
jgi:hypothetical protein